jgi:hypothetical protein
MYVTELIGQNQHHEALKVLQRFGVTASQQTVGICRQLVDEVFAYFLPQFLRSEHKI